MNVTWTESMMRGLRILYEAERYSPKRDHLLLSRIKIAMAYLRRRRQRTALRSFINFREGR